MNLSTASTRHERVGKEQLPLLQREGGVEGRFRIVDAELGGLHQAHRAIFRVHGHIRNKSGRVGGIHEEREEFAIGRALEGTDRPLHKASEMDVVPEEDALLVEHHVAAELVTVFAENAGEVVRRGAQPEGVEERVADEAKEEVEEVVPVLAGVVAVLELRIIAMALHHLHIHVQLAGTVLPNDLVRVLQRVGLVRLRFVLPLELRFVERCEQPSLVRDSLVGEELELRVRLVSHLDVCVVIPVVVDEVRRLLLRREAPVDQAGVVKDGDGGIAFRFHRCRLQRRVLLQARTLAEIGG